MSASMNMVQLIGRLGANPELKYTPQNKAVAQLSLATTDTWKDKAGARQEKTEWHRVVAWGTTAENCHKYLKKGSSIYVMGRLTTRSWIDKSGFKKYATEIVAEQVMFLDARKGGNGAGAGQHREERAPANTPPAGDNSLPAADDDVPF